MSLNKLRATSSTTRAHASDTMAKSNAFTPNAASRPLEPDTFADVFKDTHDSKIDFHAPQTANDAISSLHIPLPRLGGSYGPRGMRVRAVRAEPASGANFHAWRLDTPGKLRDRGARSVQCCTAAHSRSAACFPSISVNAIYHGATSPLPRSLVAERGPLASGSAGNHPVRRMALAKTIPGRRSGRATQRSRAAPPTVSSSRNALGRRQQTNRLVARVASSAKVHDCLLRCALGTRRTPEQSRLLHNSDKCNSCGIQDCRTRYGILWCARRKFVSTFWDKEGRRGILPRNS